MTKGPMTLMRRRLARSIDWRVDKAVHQALAAQRAVLESHEHDSPEISRRLEWSKDRSDQLEAALERLRKSVASLSVTLTDGQRAQGELLDRLAGQVDALTANVRQLSGRTNTPTA